MGERRQEFPVFAGSDNRHLALLSKQLLVLPTAAITALDLTELSTMHGLS